MRTRTLVWVGAIATMIVSGCTGQVEPGAPGEVKDPTLFASISGCSYPLYGCGTTNGTGVYYQEGGFAGMGATSLMITNFINSGTAPVQFQGRYNYPGGNWWQMLNTPGYVTSAVYAGGTYRVQAINETGTTPTITLLTSTGAPFQVTGTQLYTMELNLQFVDPVSGARVTYQLWFGQPTVETAGSPAYVAPFQIYKYPLWYRNVTANGGWNQYCFDHNGNSDPVVFQGGMFVAPTSGTVMSNSADVTLSCRLGAIAQAYAWGYDYKVDQWHYAAAIHMKRASYCGDSHYYTIGGTRFLPQDDELAQQWTFADSAIEASWSPSGATCYTQPRRTDLASLGITPFNGYCNGQLLPSCASIGQVPSVLWSYDQTPAFLIDGVTAQ